MNRMAQTSGENFSLPTIVPVDLDDVRQELEPVLSNVVEAAEKRTDERGAGFCRAHSLRRGKAKRHVHFDSFVVQDPRRFQPVGRERTLDDDVGCDLYELATLFEHFVLFGSRNLSRNGTGNNFANLGNVLLEIDITFF